MSFVGDVPLDKGSVFFAVGLLAGTTGRSTALFVTRKCNRSSPLVFALLVILVASLALLSYELIRADLDLSTHSLC